MAYSLICVHQQSVTHKEMYPNTTTNKAANVRSTVFMWQPPHSVGRRDITPVGSFHYDIVWERASHLQITMHLLIFVCLWVDVTLTAYYVNNLNGLRNMLS